MNPIEIMRIKSSAVTAQVDIFTATILDTVMDPGDASASYSLNSSGAGTGSDIPGWTWRLSGASADYQARATVTSGTLSTGTSGTWDALSTTRTWTRVRLAIGVSTVVFTLEIRRTSDSIVIDTAVITLEATVEI